MYAVGGQVYSLCGGVNLLPQDHMYGVPGTVTFEEFFTDIGSFYVVASASCTSLNTRSVEWNRARLTLASCCGNPWHNVMKFSTNISTAWRRFRFACWRTGLRFGWLLGNV